MPINNMNPEGLVKEIKIKNKIRPIRDVGKNRSFWIIINHKLVWRMVFS